MVESKNTTLSGNGAALSPLYPASIAYLIEERPLLWYESPEEYDQLRREVFDELKPEGVLNCIFIKSVVDYIWEFRRMRKMKQTVINCAMPSAATELLVRPVGWVDPDEEKLRQQAAAAAYGEDGDASDTLFSDRMREKHVTPETIHYKALDNVADRLHWISRECERLEHRFHRLLKDFEGRRTALAAMAKSLVEREKAEVVEYREAN